MVEVGQRQNQGYTVEVGSLVMDEPVASKSKKGKKWKQLATNSTVETLDKLRFMVY